MATERYKIVFSLDDSKYLKGSPVIIESGNLLVDNTSGIVFAHVKCKNISKKTILSMTICLNCFGSDGKEIYEKEFQYLDLSISANKEYSSKSQIAIENNNVRSFNIKVTQVVFDDKTIWESNEDYNLTIPKPVTIKSKYDDFTLIGYEEKICKKASCVFDEFHDLWRCSCGVINHQEDDACSACLTEKQKYKDINYDDLKSEGIYQTAIQKEEYDLNEASNLYSKIEGYKDARLRNVACQTKISKKNKKTKRILIIAIVIFLLLVAFCTAISIISEKNRTEGTYKLALSDIEAGEYNEAYDLLVSLGDYKDSKEKLSHFEKRLRETKCSVISQNILYEWNYKTEYTYDKNNKLVEEDEIYFNQDPEHHMRTTYVNGVKTKAEYTGGSYDGRVDVYSDNGLCVETTYDLSDLQVYDKVQYDEYGYELYNEHGRIETGKDYECLSITTCKPEYTFDDKGNITYITNEKTKIENPKSDNEQTNKYVEEYRFEYEYDEEDRVICKTCTVVKNGLYPDSNGTTYEEIIYEYEDGYLVKQTNYDLNAYSSSTETVYSYDYVYVK